MSDFRVGFIGCGRHSGERIYPALAPAGMKLVAVCGRNPQRTHTRAAQYNVEHVYTDHERMCDEQQLDAVIVVTGPQGHYELIQSLLGRDMDVWTEKPCAVTSKQANELTALAEKTGRHVQTGFNYRYSLGVERAVRMIESGKFAPPAMVSVRWWLGEGDTQRFMQHYVCHAIDLLHYLTPGGLTHVKPDGEMQVVHHRQDDRDWFIATLRGKTGCVAVLELAAQMSGEGHYCSIDLMSRDGLLQISDFTQVTHYGTAPWGDQVQPESQPYDGDRIWRTEPLLKRGGIWLTYGYAAQLQRFREAVQGQRPPESTVREAAWGMHVMDQLLDAAGCEARP